MCYKICNFDVEAQAYVEAWAASKTKNELFELLDQSDVWSQRRNRLGNRYSMGYYRMVDSQNWGGRRSRLNITNIEANPNHYTTWQMARYMHKALQRKGVLLPAWMSKDYHCVDNTLPLNMRLNKMLAS